MYVVSESLAISMTTCSSHIVGSRTKSARGPLVSMLIGTSSMVDPSALLHVTCPVVVCVIGMTR